MQWLPIMTRCKGMHDACVEPGFAECSIHWLVIDAGHFNSHNAVDQSLGFEGTADELRHHLKIAPSMLHVSRFDEHLAVEVT